MLIGIEGGAARARHVLTKGEQGVLRPVLGRGPGLARRRADAERAIDATVQFWRNWLARARIPDHPLRHPLERSALTIKGLTYMPTGATVAALTTSLPETPGASGTGTTATRGCGTRTFTLQALHYLNLDWEADEFMQFVADLEPNTDGSLQIMYGIDGRRDLTESTRDELSRLRRRASGADRQRGLRPASERRLRRGPRLDPAAHPAQPAPAVGCGRWCSRRRRGRSPPGGSPTRASGRRAGSRSTTCRRS